MFSSSIVGLTFVALSAIAAPSKRACTDVTVIFARGTLEAAPIGTIVGPPFQSALQSALGGKSLTFTGVNYPANIAGFEAGGDAAGSTTMANMLNSVASSCPNTFIVSSGYSQGAQLVHNSAKQISSGTASKIGAVVMFGDPDNGQTLANNLSPKSKTFCAAGDDICAGGQLILPAHLSYGANAGAAAAFVVSKM